MLRGLSCGAAGDWMKPKPLLLLRTPSKALVAESPNAHMRDLELDTMLDVSWLWLNQLLAIAISRVLAPYPPHGR